jgi:hypothetical protein
VQVIVAGKVIERETAKTPAGERTLPLDEGTGKALRELRRMPDGHSTTRAALIEPGSASGT